MKFLDFLFSTKVKRMRGRIDQLETQLLELAPYFKQAWPDNIAPVQDVEVSDVLEKFNLGITRGHTGLDGDLDVTALTFPPLMKWLAKLAAPANRRLFVYDTDGEWRRVSGNGTASNKLETPHSGCVELAVVDESGRLVSRHSIARWIAKGKSLVSLNPDAPIKRVHLSRLRSGYPEIGRNAESEPVDAVYTWVDATDPAWRELLSEHRCETDIDMDRFQQLDELRYSLRSVDMYAPWIRKIHILSNCRPPDWFRASDRVEWVDHRDVIDAKYLPTFNSHAIETFLHEIPGLSERFLYFNDDIFLSGFIRPGDFFTDHGQSVSRLEPYGMVPYFTADEDSLEEWQSAIANGARLLSRDNGRFPTKIHRHSPFAFKVSTFGKLLDRYPEETEATRTARFRHSADHTFASFLYHHFALAHGEAVESNEDSFIVRTNNHKRFYETGLYKKVRFFCANDGGGSTADEDYTRFKTDVLPKMFPFRSCAEF